MRDKLEEGKYKYLSGAPSGGNKSYHSVALLGFLPKNPTQIEFLTFLSLTGRVHLDSFLLSSLTGPWTEGHGRKGGLRIDENVRLGLIPCLSVSIGFLLVSKEREES